MLIDSAITLLEAEVVQLTALTNLKQPGMDIYWWTLQAKSLGLSHLRSLKARGIDDPQQADQVRKLYRTELQPAAETIVQSLGSP